MIILVFNFSALLFNRQSCFNGPSVDSLFRHRLTFYLFFCFAPSSSSIARACVVGSLMTSHGMVDDCRILSRAFCTFLRLLAPHEFPLFYLLTGVTLWRYPGIPPSRSRGRRNSKGRRFVSLSCPFYYTTLRLPLSQVSLS